MLHASTRSANLARLLLDYFENPLIIHEIRSRMRGARAFWLLMGYLLALLTVTAGVLPTLIDSARYFAGDGAPDVVASGPSVFGALVAAQAVLLALLAPALTCGAISLEREHQTFEMLAVTRMSVWDFLLGKLAAPLGFVLLCLAASLPIVFAALGLGALSPGQVIGAYLLLVIEAAVLGSIGLFWSACTRSTIIATLLTFPTVALGCLALVPPSLLALDVTQSAIASGISDGWSILGTLFPFTAGMVGTCGLPFYGIRIPFWLPALIVGPCLVALALCLAARRLEGVSHSTRSRPLIPAAALYFALTILITGGLLSPTETSDKVAADLWGFLLVASAVALPFVSAPAARALPMAGSGFYLRRGWAILAVWLLGATSIVWLSVLFVSAPHVVVAADHITLDTVYAGTALLVIVSFLAAEASIGLFVARRFRHRMAATLVPLIASAVVTLLPLPAEMASPDRPSILWMWLYFSPMPALLSLSPHGVPALPGWSPMGGAHPVSLRQALPFDHTWYVPTVILYLAAAVLFFVLAFIPRRRQKPSRSANP